MRAYCIIGTMRAGIQPFLLIAGLAAALLFSAASQAQFSFDGTKINALPSGGCAAFVPDCTSVVHNDESVSGQTPFVYEVVNQGGASFYHMVIGNPEDNFTQEVYIQLGGGNIYSNQATDTGADPFLPGIRLRSQSSSSGGVGPVGSCAFDCGQDRDGNPIDTPNDPTNAFSPLDNTSVGGNATGNPSRVAMRQSLRDGDLTVDFVKNNLLTKPVISNVIAADDIESTFIIDGSGNPYTAANSSPVTNTVQHRGDNLPPESSARFDITETGAFDQQTLNTTAGRYTAGNPNPGLPNTLYNYADPRENVNLNPDWSSFFDHRESNPWAYPDNRPTQP